MKTAEDLLQDKWDGVFAGLQVWVARTGQLPSRRSKDADEYSLANWLNRQRTDARKDVLDPSRERSLRAIPGALEPRQRRLSHLDLATRLAAFHLEHGRLPRQKADGEATAAGYLSQLRQKSKEGTISAEAMTVISAIPGAVSNRPPRPDYTVDERLQQLSKYLSEHGHLPSAQDSELHRWLWRASRGEASANGQEAERARTAALKLTHGYARRERKPRTESSRYLAELEAYVAFYGHLPSAGPDSAPRFVRGRLTQMLACRGLTESRTARINTLLSAPAWRQGNAEGPARIAAFYSENGRLPRQNAALYERTLAHHLSRLRARARDGRMPPRALEILAGVPGALGG